MYEERLLAICLFDVFVRDTRLEVEDVVGVGPERFHDTFDLAVLYGLSSYSGCTVFLRCRHTLSNSFDSFSRFCKKAASSSSCSFSSFSSFFSGSPIVAVIDIARRVISLESMLLLEGREHR